MDESTALAGALLGAVAAWEALSLWTTYAGRAAMSRHAMYVDTNSSNATVWEPSPSRARSHSLAWAGFKEEHACEHGLFEH